MSGGDYCEMCDLPLSTCVHGMPKPPPEPPKPVKAARASRAASASGSAVSRRRTAAAATAPTPRARLRTHQDDFKPWLLGVLQDAGGEQDAETAITATAERMAGLLLPGDHELGPQGEPRWRTALRWARKELADEGLLLAPQPGVWALTERGRDLPTELVERPAPAADGDSAADPGSDSGSASDSDSDSEVEAAAEGA